MNQNDGLWLCNTVDIWHHQWSMMRTYAVMPDSGENVKLFMLITFD